MKTYLSSPSREAVWQMFDRIASRYDLLNILLSAGQNIRWKRKFCSNFRSLREGKVLDLATGTADIPIELAKENKKIGKIIGIDLSEKMLDLGKEKVRKQGLRNIISLQKGDAVNIPFENEEFDVITISFGIRNFVDTEKSLKEIYRVLKPKGKLVILEFSLPETDFIKKCYLFYFRKVLPLIGAMLSKDTSAYKYLNRTVESFPYGQRFCRLMEKSRFANVHNEPMTFGIVSIYYGVKE